MGNLAERKRQRRDYLRKKGTANSVAVVAGLMMFAGILLLLPLALLFACGMVVGNIASELMCGALIVASGGLSVAGYRVCNWQWFDDVANLPFVPPVAPDALPVDEVLLRAADQSGVCRAVLLRAANVNEGADSGELLRAAGGEPYGAQDSGG
jgi:hypothetical protein